MAIKGFNFETRPVLPQVYNDAMSYYEQVCFVVAKLAECIESYNTFEGDVNTRVTQFESNTNNAIKLFEDSMNQAIRQYLDNIAIFENGVTNDIANFKTTTNNEIETFESNMNNVVEQFQTNVINENTLFKNQTNDAISQFETSVNNAITTFETSVNQQIDDIREYALGTGLSDAVDAKLDEYVANGTMNTIINTDIFNGMNSRINDVYINVKKFGAIGDGVADDTNAINQAIADAITIPNATLFFPRASVGYLTNTTITIPETINVVMDSPILYKGLNTLPAIVVGSSSATIVNKRIVIKVTNGNAWDWLNTGNIGVKIINANSCKIDIDFARGFYTGVCFIGDNGGFAYNHVVLSYIMDNKFGVRCTNVNAGWCNENVYIGGRFGVSSTTGVNLARYGVVITSENGDYYNNNNVFIKPSFEMNTTTTTSDAIPILIEYGQYNSILYCRNEGNDTTSARVLNNSTMNQITTGYGLITIEDNSTYPLTYSKSIRSMFKLDERLIFKANALHKKACYYDGATNVNIPEVFVCGSSNANMLTNIGGITINPTYLELASRGIGILVDTSVLKRFVLKRDVVSSNGGRVVVRCYDVNGNILTNAGAGHPYVKTTSSSTMTYTASYGGAYATGVDSATDVFFQVGSDVDHVSVILFSGTNPLQTRGFSLFTLDDGVCSTYLPYEEILKGVNLATTPPTAGTWNANKIIKNAVQAVGQPKGWICTAGGTPGTWVSEGTL